jgi:hypothetical protein
LIFNNSVVRLKGLLGFVIVNLPDLDFLKQDPKFQITCNFTNLPLDWWHTVARNIHWIAGITSHFIHKKKKKKNWHTYPLSNLGCI